MNSTKAFCLLVIWVTIALVLVGSYRLYSKPQAQKAQQMAREQAEERAKKDLINRTSGSRHFDHKITFGIDSFSGYAVLRSPEFANHLASRSIKLELQDDEADYTDRFKKLQSGELQMAVFTVDSLVKASAQFNDLPATIVAVVGSRSGPGGGVYAIIVYKSKYPNIQSLNNPKTQFVVVPDTPSEMLVRSLQVHFALPLLSPDCYTKVDSTKEIYEIYTKSRQTDDLAYVVYWPNGQKMLENPNLHVIADTSHFREVITDVMVANRRFLAEKSEVVQEVVQCYFRSAYESKDNMAQLVLDDKKPGNVNLSSQQAEALVDRITWKNVLENYVHLGVRTGPSSSSLQHIEAIISNAITVLLGTKAIPSDPTDGSPNKLYYDNVLRTMSQNDFHPGRFTDTPEAIQEEVAFKALSDEQWKSLLPVGNFQTDPLVFARGSVRLTSESQATLDQFVKQIQLFPNYYVAVKGNALTVGNIEANRTIALERAETVVAYLIDRGISLDRIKAIAGEPTGEPSVTFILGQRPY